MMAQQDVVSRPLPYTNFDVLRAVGNAGDSHNTVSATEKPLSEEEVTLMNRYWHAANYLIIGQIYMMDNVLLRRPLDDKDLKPRLLGHWGTSTGQAFIYVHLNRLIKKNDINMIYLSGPGHGGPAMVAHAYMEGTYTEVYPSITEDEQGMQRLFKQFSAPGGIPSHVSPPTPGSMHEGGELGYVLLHAFGAVFDNPDLIAAAVVGDGEAETCPLEGSWKSVNFLNPIRDGAVLPILHLNGYKIAGPTVLGREKDENVRNLLSGHGYDVHFVEGDDPAIMHQNFAATLDICYSKIKHIQEKARAEGVVTERPRWPVIVLRSPKGWSGISRLDGHQVEGTWRAHQVPMGEVRGNEKHKHLLEQWLRSYEPHMLFDDNGKLRPELRKLAPLGKRRMSANPVTNGGNAARSLIMPELHSLAMKVDTPAQSRECSTYKLGELMRELYKKNPSNFRLFCPDETASNRLHAVFEVTKRCMITSNITNDDVIAADGRVFEVLSEHLCQGWLEGYTLTGRHGLWATYESFAMVVTSMANQHCKWLQEIQRLPWRVPIPSLNILLSSTCWRNDHNGFSHQGPGFIDQLMSNRGTVSRIYLPPDGNCLLAVAHHCFRHKNHINLIVIDKQPQFQYLNIDSAVQHLNDGASIWKWVHPGWENPDVILACAGDIPTQEALAAADWLIEHAPKLKLRFVNVIDLMTMYTPQAHPHGMSTARYESLFGIDLHVVFAFHGYPGAIHMLNHNRPNPTRFHVRGFTEHGTTTTPFEMVSCNHMSRYHLVKAALGNARNRPDNMKELIDACDKMIQSNTDYACANLEDLPEISNWKWNAKRMP